MALGFTISFSFHIPGPPLDADKLRLALDLVVRKKMPQAGARLVIRNGVCLWLRYPDEIVKLTTYYAETRVPHPKDILRYK